MGLANLFLVCGFLVGGKISWVSDCVPPVGRSFVWVVEDLGRDTYCRDTILDALEVS